MPARAVTTWPAAAVTGPEMTRVAPFEAKRPPAKVVFSMRIGPESVPTPEEAERKIAPSPTRPEAKSTLIGLAMVTSWSIWNWPALKILTTLVLAPRAPEASTRNVLLVPPLMVTSPTKSLAPLRRMTRPGPDLVRPTLPVIFDSMARKPEAEVFH